MSAKAGGMKGLEITSEHTHTHTLHCIGSVTGEGGGGGEYRVHRIYQGPFKIILDDGKK